MANSVDPDQTPRFAASDLGLHSLLRPLIPSIQVYYGKSLSTEEFKTFRPVNKPKVTLLAQASLSQYLGLLR